MISHSEAMRIAKDFSNQITHVLRNHLKAVIHSSVTKYLSRIKLSLKGDISDHNVLIENAAFK